MPKSTWFTAKHAIRDHPIPALPNAIPSSSNLSAPVAPSYIVHALSSPPRGMTLTSWCARYKIKPEEQSRLESMEFEISTASLDHVQQEHWQAFGFTVFSWGRVAAAVAAYRRDREMGAV